MTQLYKYTHIYPYLYITYVCVCWILHLSISNQVSEIICLKETGIFIGIHEIVQKFLEQQWKNSAVWRVTFWFANVVLRN